MGSFNVTCVVSHLSISQYDPAVLLPLKLDKHAFGEFGFQFGQAFQVYPAIRGIYNDYGSLTEIQPSAYYQHSYNGVAWLDLAEGNQRDAIEGFTYTWVHGAVYNAMIAGLPSSERVSANPLVSTSLGADMLRRMGFVEVGKTGMERYDRKFVDTRCPDYFIACDGQFSKVYHNDEELEQFIYSPQDLIDAWPASIDTSALAGQRLFDLLLDQQINDYQSAMKMKADSTAFLRKFSQKDPGMITEQDAADFIEMLNTSGNYALDRMEQHMGMKGVIAPVVDHLQDVKKELADLGQFLLACSLTGTLITPSYAGPQFGDHPASFALAELIYQLAKGNLASYQDNDEDNDE